YHTLRTPFIFASFSSWKGAFNRPVEEQIALYKTPEFRDAFRQELKGKGGVIFTGQWDRLSVVRVTRPENKVFISKSIEEVAARRQAAHYRAGRGGRLHAGGRGGVLCPRRAPGRVPRKGDAQLRSLTRGPGSAHAVQEAAQGARAVSSLGSFAVSSDKMSKLV